MYQCFGITDTEIEIQSLLSAKLLNNPDLNKYTDSVL